MKYRAQRGARSLPRASDDFKARAAIYVLSVALFSYPARRPSANAGRARDFRSLFLELEGSAELRRWTEGKGAYCVMGWGWDYFAAEGWGMKLLGRRIFFFILRRDWIRDRDATRRISMNIWWGGGNDWGGGSLRRCEWGINEGFFSFVFRWFISVLCLIKRTWLGCLFLVLSLHLYCSEYVIVLIYNEIRKMNVRSTRVLWKHTFYFN